MNFINNIKHKFTTGNNVEKLIYINIGVFLISLLVNVLQSLYKVEVNWLVNWFALEDNLASLLWKPWSLLSYGFLHDGFIHLLFNLITLYYIGNLFIEYFTQKQLLNFYLLGTFFGGLLFIGSHNYFPVFSESASVLVGASAGISAIFIGVATYIPNYQLKIRFIGFVKLWHLAAIWVGLDVIGLAGGNAGGHFAHLGGTLFGFLYVNQASNKKGNFLKDFFSYFNKKNTPLKTVYNSKKKQPNTTKKATNNSLNQQQVDAILDKISKSGYETLTKEEKEFLFKQGKK